jgi:cytochrome c553
MLVRTPVRVAVLVVASLVLAACGGGPKTQVNQVTTAAPLADYTGPAASNADVQAFRVNLWENIKANNRCGGCHGAGGQSPQFARNDDVNLAYQAANTVVNLAQPDQSRMVTKVAGGHNCWLASNSACGDILTTWIRNWAGATASGGRAIALQAPTLKDVGASKTFPASSAGFAATVYPLVRQYCSRCHSASATTPQSPFFASGNVDEAYAAARIKINLDTPAQSRLVVRLRTEFHNCWSDCASNATTMENAIRAFADQVPLTQVDSSLVLSKALKLYDGTVASGGNRYDTNVIALYEFKTGQGNVAYDTSGVEPALNLSLTGDVSWVGGWGISVKPSGKAQGTSAASAKLANLIKSTGEYTVEAWAAPANVVQENANIVSYSAGTTARNVTLAQQAYQYVAQNRSNRTGANGTPALITNAADRDAQASLQHVVLTFDPVNGRRLYVNGTYTGDADAQGGGSLADWDDTFAFVLGNETSGNRQWQGVLKLVAVHNRALTAAQVRQNFAAGVGERYFLLFSVSHLVDVPQSYLMFEASQYDSYSYLFTKPTFISLDPNARPDQIRIRGLRLGVNGTEVKVGQAYIPLDATIAAARYDAKAGQQLVGGGTVIGLEKGPDSDEFFVSFEQIGTRTHTYVEPGAPPPAAAVDLPQRPDIGLRTFERISATMSSITGVPTTNAAVAQTYDRVKQQLPTVESIETFLASHQVAVSQLAIEYCNALAEDTTLRASVFPGFDFNAPAGSYLSVQANRDLLINPLIARGIGTNIGTQPSDTAVRTELNSLIGRLTACGAGCAPDRTRTVAKAACAAVVGSATTLLQ